MRRRFATGGALALPTNREEQKSPAKMLCEITAHRISLQATYIPEF
jgi:hypothetical protein